MLKNFTPPTLETLTLEVLDSQIAVMSINRPDRMNSMTFSMFEEFNTVAYALRDTDARALILRGAGERSFCAGFDLDEISGIADLGVRDFLKFQELATGGLSAIHQLPFPVIAAIHGAASGGGLALALTADIRLVAPTAKINAAFVKVGLSAGELGTSWILTRLIGPGMASELAFTGRMVGAEEAVRIGLANRLVESDKLIESAIALGVEISQNTLGGIRASKRALWRNAEVASYAAALELENRGQAMLVKSPETVELLSRFGSHS